jgi:AraC-like DNA-binding protein
MATPDPWAPSDPLGEALHILRMNGAYYCRSELRAPWGFTQPPMPGYIWFHAVISGRASVETEGSAVIWMEPGDLALVPHGEGHRLRSEPGVPVPDVLDLGLESVSDRYDVLRVGEGGPLTNMICGAVRFDHPAAEKLVEILPETIHIEASNSGRSEWIHSALGLMAAEARELRPGGEAVMTRLADILLIQAIRSWIDADPAAQTGWFGALRDPYVGRAIVGIHRDPARPWTVASLADEAAMSRSAFAARFAELVGEPPVQYVTRWRMQVAHAALRDDGTTVSELADRLGYRSEAAFARAFKRVTGVAPGAVKRQEAGEPGLATF